MTDLDSLRQWATDKTQLSSLRDFFDIGLAFSEYRDNGNLQAELVARNRNEYRFLQYGESASFQITRPINMGLFSNSYEELENEINNTISIIEEIRDGGTVDDSVRNSINASVYTCQQSIGAILDSLSSRSNQARKLNGDLFERFVGLLVNECGVECTSGVVTVPVRDERGEHVADMRYQHDAIIEVEGEVRAIGSVKTSSKDRIDKIFIDKMLYNRLTGVDTPHFAIFLHDVQRAGKEPDYRVSETFLPGHFRGYTVSLNPLDGVYYCDLLPKMRSDPMLSEHISTLDRFFIDDLAHFTESPGVVDVEVDEEYE